MILSPQRHHVPAAEWNNFDGFFVLPETDLKLLERKTTPPPL